MNWYKLAQEWNRFAPRQRQMPFMYEPGLAHKSTPFMDPDMIADEYEEGTDFNVYHVTTNLAGVLSSGGLKSRDELGNVGLGGGWKNEASNMISTTYDYNRALGIYHEMIYVAEIVKGMVLPSAILSDIEGKVYDSWENPLINKTLAEYLPKNIYKQLRDGQVDEKVLDKYIVSPQQRYEFFQKLEQAVTEDELQSEDTYTSSVIGFTGDFASMAQLNPAQIAILQLAVRKGAQSEHIPYEKEVRFRPEDVWVIRYLQPK